MISGFHGNVNATAHPVFSWQHDVATKDQHTYEKWTQWPPQPSLVHRLHISICTPAVLQTGLYKLLFICSVHVPAQPVYNTWREYVNMSATNIAKAMWKLFHLEGGDREVSSNKAKSYMPSVPKNIPMVIWCCSVYIKAFLNCICQVRKQICINNVNDCGRR